MQLGAWNVTDGMIHLKTSQGHGGNITTDREFGNFELVFEWTISGRGNNGIKYRVKAFDESTLGLEYQVIDDEGVNGFAQTKKRVRFTASMMPLPHDALKSPGEFNRGRIVVCCNHIEHWLNGHLLVNANVGDTEWYRR